MTLGNVEYKIERNKIWNDEIIIEIEKINNLIPDSNKEEKEVFNEIINDIYLLENEQWWIEDSAREIGNNEAALNYKLYVEPIFSENV